MKHMSRSEADSASPPLRRFREAVCLGCAILLWLVAWGIERGGFDGHRGHTALVSLGALEALFLGVVFWREQMTRSDRRTPWITVAWASLPAWCALELLVGSFLAGR